MDSWWLLSANKNLVITSLRWQINDISHRNFALNNPKIRIRIIFTVDIDQAYVSVSKPYRCMKSSVALKRLLRFPDFTLKYNLKWLQYFFTLLLSKKEDAMLVTSSHALHKDTRFPLINAWWRMWMNEFYLHAFSAAFSHIFPLHIFHICCCCCFCFTLIMCKVKALQLNCSVLVCVFCS